MFLFKMMIANLSTGFVALDRSSLFQFSLQRKMLLTYPWVTPGFQPDPIRIRCVRFRALTLKSEWNRIFWFWWRNLKLGGIVDLIQAGGAVAAIKALSLSPHITDGLFFLIARRWHNAAIVQKITPPEKSGVIDTI
jgi:hypothetical protein